MRSYAEGKPAVYTKYGIDSGILVGDTMSMMALQWSRSNLDPSHQAAIINCMVDTSIEICQGQQMDMDFEERDLVLESEYLNDYMEDRGLIGSCA